MNEKQNVQESGRFGLDAECKLRHAMQQLLNSSACVGNKKMIRKK
jgi:hypothetical protein